MLWNYTAVFEIQQYKPIPNQVVEVGEELSILLDEYYQGSLLKYDFKVQNKGNTYTNSLQNTMITMNKTFQNFNSSQFGDSSFRAQKDPLPRSTIFYKDYIDQEFFIYFIDSTLNLHKYDVRDTSLKKINEIFSFSLDTSLVNQTCSDLIQFFGMPDTDTYFVMFCKSYRLYDPKKKDEYEQINTIVQFDDINDIQTKNSKPNFRYVQYASYYSSFDSNFGIKFLGLEQAAEGEDPHYALLLNVQKKKFQDQELLIPYVTRFNFTIFNEMKKNNKISVQLDIGNEKLFFDKFQIQLDPEVTFKNNKLIDILDIPVYNDQMMVALLYDNEGFVICDLGKSVFYKSNTSYIYPCNGQNTQTLIFDHVLSMHKSMDEYSHNISKIYITLTYPPGVIEVDFADPNNPFIQKVYVVNDEDSKFIGKRTVAANANYIVHLMEDIVTGVQALRLYTRNSNYFDIAKADYILPEDSHSNFFFFPNYYLNILWFRDEIRVNITGIFESNLVLGNSNKKTLENLNLAHLYEQQLNVTLYIWNNFESLNQSFLVTFVSENNTSIQSRQDDLTSLNSIFYSCGDQQFRYIITDFVNGPNFKLKVPDISNEEKERLGFNYFKFVNKNFSETNTKSFDFTGKCPNSYTLPAQSEDGSSIENQIILICILKENYTITAYSIDIEDENKSIILINEIKIPYLYFAQIIFDKANRQIFIIARVLQSEWTLPENLYEIHFFKIKHSVIWQDYYNDYMKSFKLDKIRSVTFSNEFKKGLFIYEPEEDKQYFSFYEASYTDMQLTNILTAHVPLVNITEDEMIRGLVSNDSFFFALTTGNKIKVFEIQYAARSSNGSISRTFQRVSEMQFDKDLEIIDFDIFDSRFFILYTGSQTVMVYEIVMRIYLQFRMVLPLYEYYKDFHFQKIPQSGGKSPLYKINRSYANQYLSIILMNDPDLNQTSKINVFVYFLAGQQHNTFVMTKSLSRDFYMDQKEDIIAEVIDNYQHQLTLMFDDTIMIYKVTLRNYLTINQDYQGALIRNCSSITVPTIAENNGFVKDHSTRVSLITVQAKSIFPEEYQHPPEIESQNITLEIFSENQGLAVRPTVSNSLKVSYADDVEDSDQQKNTSILLENLVEGINLHFNVSCSFMNDRNEVESCDDGVDNESMDDPYEFYIEFVTFEREVLYSFSLGKFFLILDSKNFINLLKLPNDKDNLIGSNNTALQSYKKDLKQEELLNCNVADFAKVFNLTSEDNKKDYCEYLMVFQCNNKTSKNVLKIASIKIYDQPQINSAKDSMNYIVFEGNYSVKLKILDAAIFGNISDSSNSKFRIAATIEIENSYTNLLQIYEVTIVNNVASFKLLDFFNSITENKNTFKLTKMLPINKSNLLLVVSQFSGAFIFDIQNIQMVGEIDAMKDDSFKRQDLMQRGPLEIFSAAGDFPNSIHLITNYGFFFYFYNVSLEDRDQIFPNYEKTLVPAYCRIVRIYFQHFANEMAQNPYGYAFLVTSQIDQFNFEVHLGAVSYFSATNSKIFRSQKVAVNQQCVSLNEEKNLASSMEDQIAVSFVCGSQIFIVRVCTRPNLRFHFDDIHSSGTRMIGDGTYEASVHQFNQYNVTIEATNGVHYDDDHKSIINLTVEFSCIHNTEAEYLSQYGLVFLLMILIFLIILVISKSRFIDKSLDLEDQKSLSEFEKPSTAQNRFSIFSTNFDQPETGNLDLQRFRVSGDQQQILKNSKISQDDYHMLIAETENARASLEEPPVKMSRKTVYFQNNKSMKNEEEQTERYTKGRRTENKVKRILPQDKQKPERKQVFKSFQGSMAD